MFNAAINATKTTSYKVVLPFYVYASLSFIVATGILFIAADGFTGHYFHPKVLAVTHIMALGWGSMMILGASHQLVPVLIEGKLYSNALGYLCFFFAGIGVIFLVWGFYYFDFGWVAQTGGLMVVIAFIFYLINIGVSMAKSNHQNVHAAFVFTGTLWMLITIILGVLLLFNFTYNVLSYDSLHYLPLHAHLGIVGWFLMLIMGVGSRLIPMFMISKFNNVKRLWQIFYLVNGALLLFFVSFILKPSNVVYFISTLLVVLAITLFIHFCYKAWQGRLRKKLEPQLKISILSSWMMLLPAIILVVLYSIPVISPEFTNIALVYGFCIFFGWISAIIFGMTFKTLPFILWNKKFHQKAGAGRTPNPRELFSQPVFRIMLGFYFLGFVLFIAGLLLSSVITLKTGAALLLVTALLFNANVFKMLQFKS